MHDPNDHTPGEDLSGPFGYAACTDCGVTVQRRVLASAHDCDPDRYAGHQASRLHWRRNGFDDAVQSWLATPAGRFAEFYARRLLDDLDA